MRVTLFMVNKQPYPTTYTPAPPGTRVVATQHLALTTYLDALLAKATEPPVRVMPRTYRCQDNIETLFDTALSEPQQPDDVPSKKHNFDLPTACLQFSVAGIAYALPLIDIYRITRCTQRISAVPGRLVGCVGTLVEQGKRIEVLDLPVLVGGCQNNGFKDENEAIAHLLQFGGGGLALIVDQLGEVINVGVKDIQWPIENHTDRWRAGFIKQTLTTLLDIDGLSLTLAQARHRCPHGVQ